MAPQVLTKRWFTACSKFHLCGEHRTDSMCICCAVFARTAVCSTGVALAAHECSEVVRPRLHLRGEDRTDRMQRIRQVVQATKPTCDLRGVHHTNGNARWTSQPVGTQLFAKLAICVVYTTRVACRHISASVAPRAICVVSTTQMEFPLGHSFFAKLALPFAWCTPRISHVGRSRANNAQTPADHAACDLCGAHQAD